jgi:hypothetical protein
MSYRMTCMSLCMVGAMLLAGCRQGNNPQQMVAEANALDQKFFEMYVLEESGCCIVSTR